MDPKHQPIKAGLHQPRVTRGMVITQSVLGPDFASPARPAVPAAHARPGAPAPAQRHLFVINHISLLDTLLLAALCWRSRCYPILVLGDKNIWHASWIRRFLSRRTAFLLERGKLNPNRIQELRGLRSRGPGISTHRFSRRHARRWRQCGDLSAGNLFHRAGGADSDRAGVHREHAVDFHEDGPVSFLPRLRKVEVHFGEPIAPETYLPMPREEFLELCAGASRAAANRRHQHHIRVPSRLAA